MRTLLVTGGAGFIGSALIRHLLADGDYRVVNVDKLTYAASLDALESAAENPCYAFIQADVSDASAMERVFGEHQPDGVIHLAAESHVDRSIEGPAEFIQTNIVGTFRLLDVALGYWRALSQERRNSFRFHHVSTDEVYGSIGSGGFSAEDSPYAPNSPYSASKAGADHLVRAWHRTYGLPVVTTRCSNNYGPYQHPEKLIPLTILNAVAGKPLPVYGSGENVRDWLHVEDHVRAILAVFQRGRVGETYNVGGHNQTRNVDLVHRLCDLLDALRPSATNAPYREQVRFVTDRPGHDLRYAMDAGKIECELGWTPHESFDRGLRKTVHWYLDHLPWCARPQSSTDDSRAAQQRMTSQAASGIASDMKP